MADTSFIDNLPGMIVEQKPHCKLFLKEFLHHAKFPMLTNIIILLYLRLFRDPDPW